MKTTESTERPSRTWRSSRKFSSEAKRLGACIRAMRKAQGLTLAEASRRMDVDLHHLQKVETGTLNVTLVTLVRIVHGLGKPFCALCGKSHGKSATRARRTTASTARTAATRRRRTNGSGTRNA